MRESIRTALARVRNPEYTGENRCVPCTIVNVSLAAAGSAIIGSVSRKGGAAAFAGSLAAIGLRGYLVPGTPALTKRYLPAPILERFDAHPLEESDEDAEALTTETIEEYERQQERAVNPERFLLDVGAVELRENDLGFTDDLADRIDGRLRTLPDDPLEPALVAELYGLEPAAVTVADRPYPAVRIGRRIHKWPSTAALRADLATHRALEGLTDRWREVPQAQRIELLEVLRSFRERCPDCGGPITLTEDTVDSCCQTYAVHALNCDGCEQPLLEFDPDDTDRGASGGFQP
ncbi:hypothetical protein C491_03200 [Natronococcus amylolyticus DSM 10524]|uniref:Uncharacterized protein n=1 Tax=Natronococcus amylolyticus DSM 10524 TaxID=1227497 RepID=L9XHW9_9EURY|nr:hypothetical protein [Natronococcus amylolyticus]ELY60268.1 hypothetical protein C491_03200 [Natronococcus amylolyticus DSM 10524]